MSYITVSPTLAKVSCKGGFTLHTLECIGIDRLCFRIKLKKEYFQLYRVSPPVGFLLPGQKKQLILERRPGKPGKASLIVEYMKAPLSGCHQWMPFARGTVIGRVNIEVKAYEDQKIANSITCLQKQTFNQYEQKFQALALAEEEVVLEPSLECKEYLTNNNDKVVKANEIEESETKHQEIHSPKQLVSQPSQSTQKVGMANFGAVVGASTDKGDIDTVNSHSGIIDIDGYCSDKDVTKNEIQTIINQIEKISGQFEAMKSVVIERQQQRKIDEKLEKILFSLSYMKFVLIGLIILFLTNVSFLLEHLY